MLHEILGVPTDAKGFFSNVATDTELYTQILRLLFSAVKLLFRGSKLRVSHAFVPYSVAVNFHIFILTLVFYRDVKLDNTYVSKSGVGLST
jgi:hypothetical protein